MNYDDKITKNFYYREILRSKTALRLGIDNTPNPEQIKNAEFHAHNIMQPTRDKFGKILVSSWFRVPELCVAIGSKETSNHTTGGTTDFYLFGSKTSLISVGIWIAGNRDFSELIFEYMPHGWLHCASFKGRNERVIKLKDKNLPGGQPLLDTVTFHHGIFDIAAGEIYFYHSLV